MDPRPEILPVVETAGVVLKKSGRSHFGLCPFHSEKTPSFAVNAEKNVFYCHGCHEGGDAVRFIEKLHGVNFKEALKILNIDGGSYRPDAKRISRRKRAREIAEWARATSIKLRDALLEIGQQAHTARKILREYAEADKVFLREYLASLGRQWDLLTTLDDDLNGSALVGIFQSARADVESLVEGLA